MAQAEAGDNPVGASLLKLKRALSRMRFLQINIRVSDVVRAGLASLFIIILGTRLTQIIIFANSVKPAPTLGFRIRHHIGRV